MEKTCYKKRIVKGIVAILILTCFGHQSCHQGTVPQTREIAKAEMSDDDLQNYQYLFSEATKNKVLGDIPRAIDYYQKCLMINPGSDASMYALSSLYSMVGEYSKSLEYAIEASKLDPDNLYRALSVLDKSIEVYEEIHRRFPERDDLYFALGNLYAENDQHTEAIDVFDRLENQYGLQENIILAKEESYEAMKMYDEAIQEVRNLKKLFPDKVRYRLMEAEIFYLRGDIQDSDSLYRVIEETAPDDHLVIISRIGFYRETGDTNMTVTYLDKMIRDATLELDLKLEFMAALLNDDKDIRFLGPDLGTLFLTLEKAYEGDVRVVGMVADYYVRSGNYIEAKYPGELR
jgi:tetratricopeptide (TPR) repeat protein